MRCHLKALDSGVGLLNFYYIVGSTHCIIIMFFGETHVKVGGRWNPRVSQRISFEVAVISIGCRMGFALMRGAIG